MKIGIKTFFKDSGIALLSAALIFVCSSCEIGLGAAVDTDAPMVDSIDSPAENSARRGSIDFRGTCSDDSGVDYLKVTLTNNDYPGRFSYDWTIDPDSSDNKKWGFSLIHNEGNSYTVRVAGADDRTVNLPDGTYVLDMVAVDYSTRISGKLSRSFDIDNTPPVFLLSSPNSLDISDPTKYGQSITLKGTISDDHPCTDADSVKVKLYRNNNGTKGTEVPLVVKDFTIADTANVSMVLARYAGDGYTPSNDIQQNYAVAYANDYSSSAPDQKYFLEIEISDKTEGPEDDPEPNKNTSTYIREKLISFTHSGAGVDENTILEGSDFRQIWNGTYEGSLNASQVSAIKAALDGTDTVSNETYEYKGNPEKPFALNVNKNANPTYSIGAFALGNSTIVSDWVNCGNDSAISFNVKMGVDEIPVEPSSISVKVYKCTSMPSSIADVKSRIQSSTPVWQADKNNNYTYLYESETSNTDGSIIPRYLKDKTLNVDEANYTIKLPGGVGNITMGSWYIIVLDGQDTNGNHLIASENQYYGFYTSLTGNPPSINADGNQWKQYAGSSSTYPFEVRITDSVSASENYTSSEGYLKATVKRYNGYYENEASLPTTSVSTDYYTYGNFSRGGPTGQSNEFKEILNLPAFGTTDGVANYTYTIKVEAKNGAGEAFSRTYFYYVDSKAPVITFNDEVLADETNLNPVITEKNNYYNSERGTYSLSLLLQDTDGSGIATFSYDLDGDGTPDEEPEAMNGVKSMRSMETFAVTESSGVDIALTVVDKCENSRTVSKTLKFDFADPVFVKFPEAKTIKNSRGVFEIEATDSLALSTLTITATRNGQSYSSNTPSAGLSFSGVSTSEDGKTQNGKIIFEGVAANGTWSVEAVATDSAGRVVRKTFEVVYDQSAPVISSTFNVPGAREASYTCDGDNYFSLGNPVVNLSIDENVSGLSSIYYLLRRADDTTTLPDLSAWKTFAKDGCGSNIEVPVEVNKGSGEEGYVNASAGVGNVLYVRAKDKAGNVSDSKPFNVSIDPNPPSMNYRFYSTGSEIKDVDPNSSTVYYKGSTVTLYGNVSDAESGVASVVFPGATPTIKYTTQELTKENAGSSSIWKNYSASDAVNIKAWMATFTPTETTTNVTARASDVAGMTGDTLSLCILVKDVEHPTLSDLSLHDGDKVWETSMVDNGDGTYGLSVSGKWSDNASGTAWLKYSYNDGTEDVFTDVLVEDIATNITSPAVGWNFTLNVHEGIDQSIKLKYCDNAGNEHEENIGNLVFDFSAPTFDTINFKPVYAASDLNENKATILITARDDLGITSYSISASKDNGTPYTSDNLTAGVKINNGGSGAVSVGSITFTSPAADGVWVVTVTATDEADRTVTTTFTTTVDGTVPSLETFSVMDELWDALKFYNKTTMKFSGTIKETVGMGKVYYKFDYNTSTTARPDSLLTDSDARVISLTGKGDAMPFAATYTEFQSDNDSKYNRLFLQVVDKAGNPTSVVEKQIHLDTANPDFTVTHYQNGEDGNPEAIDGKVLTSGVADFIVYGTFSDDVSGVDGITFTVAGSSIMDVAGVTVKYAPEVLSDTALKNYSGWTDIGTGNCKNIKHWKLKIPASYLSSITGKAVSAKPVDKAGNGVVKTAFTLFVDSENPSVNSASLSGAYKSGMTYYVNNKSFAFTGTSSDNYGIRTTSYELKKGASRITGDEKTLVGTRTSDAWTWSVDFSDAAVWPDKTEGTLTVTTTDLVGRTDSVDYNIIVDSTGPEILSNIFTADYTYQHNPVQKDHMFYVGNGQYSESSFTNQSSFPVSGYLKETGSGMARIYYQICHSGDTPMTTENYESLASSSKIGSIITFEGPTTKPEHSGRVMKMYVTDGDGKVTSQIDYTNSSYYSFEEILNGFAVSSGSGGAVTGDTLYLLAVDNCGNLGTYRSFKINVDQEINDFKVDSSEVRLTNGSQDIEITGTAKDSLAGIEIINFLVGHEPYFVSAYDDESCKTESSEVLDYLHDNGYDTYGNVRFYALTNGAYSATAEKIDFYKTDSGAWQSVTSGLPRFFMENGPNQLKWKLTITPDISWFNNTNMGSNPVVYADVRDYAGNTFRYQVAVLKLDTEPPEAEITSPRFTGAMNGTYDIMGTVSDGGNTPKSIYLYKHIGDTAPSTLSSGWTLVQGYTTDEDEAAANASVSKVDASKVYNWVFEDFNFNEFAGSSVSGTGQLLLVAYDEAGNCNINPLAITDDKYTTYSVDLNSDRPVVSFHEITNDGSVAESEYVAKYTTRIYGTVTDDDGVAVLKISPQSYNTEAEWKAYDQPSGTLNYTPGSTSVSFNYAPDSTDGEKELYIYVKDTNGTSFWTANAPVWYEPKAVYAGSSDETDLATVVKYRSDSNPPTFTVACDYGVDADEAETKALTKLGTSMTASERCGGTAKKFMCVVVRATDDNGIKWAKGSFAGSAEQNFTQIGDPHVIGGKTYYDYKFTYEIAGLTSGQKTLSVTVSDSSELETVKTNPVVVDNTGPVISVNVNSSTQLSGIVSITGTSYDELGSDVESMWCMVPNNDYYNSTDEDALKAAMKGPASGANAPLDGSLLSWTATFNETDGLLKKLPTTTGELADYSDVSHDAQDIYTMKIFVLAQDSLGNETLVTDKTFRYNPFGDRPVVAVVSPGLAKDDDNNTLAYAMASGSVRVSGTAHDNEAVGSVYLQIAMGKHGTGTNGEITDADITAMADNTTIWDSSKASAAGYTVVTKASLMSSEHLTEDKFAVDPSFWGIKATSTGSWYSVLNKNNCLENDDTEDYADAGTYTFWVRAAAFDNNGLLGPWSTPRAVCINPKSPSIGNQTQKVVFYNDDGDIIGERAYQEDMWVSGTAVLVTSAEHKNGISNITGSIGEYGTTNFTTTDYVSDKVIKVDGSRCVVKNYGETSGYEVRIPLSVGTGSGTREVRINAIEASESALGKEQVYTFKYDNVAPEIDAMLYANGDEFVDGKKLQNSNLQLSVGGAVSDDNSGFDRLLFAFYRGTGASRRVLDTQRNNEQISTTGLTSKSLGGQTVYGKQCAISWGDSNTQFTIDAASDFVRAGGVVQIGNVWYGISSVSSTTVTISEGVADTSSAAAATAFIPYMQVVDNTSAEGITQWLENGHTFKDGRDDGDGMLESVSKSGNTWTWDATLHGNFMADGPVDFVVIAIDKAGNAAGAIRTGSVENNPPRIAKVYLGTDLNSDGEFASSEFELYDIYGVSSMYQNAYDLVTATYSTVSGTGSSRVIVESDRPAFTVKNKLAVYPELVGGNGTIRMVFNNDAESLQATETDDDGNSYSYPTVVQGTGANLLELETISTASPPAIQSAFVISNEMLMGKASWSDADDLPKIVSFTFWDSTSVGELTPGTDTQSCVLRVMDLRLDLTDGIAPKTVINPLYWNSGDDNSLYDNSKSNGHIELPDSWMSSTLYSAEDNSGQYDADPKVSGKITFTGYVYDETKLDSILVGFGGAEMTDSLGNVSGKYKAASFATGVWETASATMADNGWEISVEPVYYNQRGHKVKWTLSIDTEKRGKIGVDKNLEVIAVDAAGGKSASAEVESGGDGVENKSVYKLDIVPYIMGLKTSLSSTRRSDDYDRTVLGHFPVSATETFYVYGFNLEGGKFVVNEATPVSFSGTVSWAGYTAYGVSASSLSSGPFYVVRSDVKSINNMNDNDFCGEYVDEDDYGVYDIDTLYSNYPNRFPNGVTNNLLTDDMELDVWQFKNNAATSSDGRADEPHMRINPNSGMIGFEFLNGAYAFAMPTSTSSYSRSMLSTTDFMVSGNFTYDSAGNTFGGAAGQDSNDNSADPYWVKTGVGKSWRIELTGQKGARLDGYKQATDGLSPSDTTNWNIKDKIKCPAFATYRPSGQGYTNVYMAYYDSWNNEIRFRYGKWTSDNSVEGTLFTDGYSTKTISSAGPNSGYYECMNAQVLATTFSGDESVAISGKPSLASKYSGAPLGGAGEYVSIDVDPTTGFVVLVWYDAEEDCTRYAFNTKPTDLSWQTNKTVKDFSGLNHANWTGGTKIFENAGEYCQVKVAGDGSVHIAAYDSASGDLVYARLPKCNSSYDASTMSCIVDSKGIMGKQLTLDVGLDSSGKAIPYIGYVYGSKAKLAYRVSSNVVAAGADSDFYTGNWEASYIPSSSSLCTVDAYTPNDSLINVGLWKDAYGKIKSSTTAPNGNTNIYGNGTANPIMGYQVWANPPVTTIETAQKK